MAGNSTIYKAALSIVDIDRNYYADHVLTLACHPSETTERMMMRIFAFAINAHEYLVPAAGMTDNDEPDFWQKDLTGSIDLWIEVGQPDDRRILKACGRSNHVKIYSYNPRPLVWWTPLAQKVGRAKNLSVYSVDAAASRRLTAFAARTIEMQITIQDGEIWVRNDALEVPVTVSTLLSQSL